MTTSSAEVVLLSGGPSAVAEPPEIQSAADLFGLRIERTDVVSAGRTTDPYSKLQSPSTVAVLAAYDALPALDMERTIAALRRPDGKSVPMLVYGIAADGDARVAAAWSSGGIKSCGTQPEEYRPEALRFKGAPARTLAGWELPAVAAPLCDLESTDRAETIIAARRGERMSSVLLRVRQDSAEILFVPRMHEFDRSWRGDPGGLAKAFSALAPFVLFLANAAGDYGWHLDGSYANLTIDDPWLTQPFGNLDYPALLAEMEKYDFHTTIAFIPWNYDRSAAAVATLVRAHGNRFSICVHGNNHTHREFGDYGPTPLAGQLADIKQGVARMERFSELTGIPYDRFMVFPHSVAPEPTLAGLATHGFVGTANSINVPSGTRYPSDPVFVLRPFTSAYGRLLSLQRNSVEGRVPGVEIAIHSFLGNPLLFYGHENIFENGADGFNQVADLVNRTRPDTHWTNLGEIARHTHLLRRRDERTMEVRMFSNEMDLTNPASREVMFHIIREEGTGPAIGAVSVNGEPGKFERRGNTIALTLAVPAHSSAKVRMEYEGAVDPRQEDVRKTSVYAYVLRRTSDFRDLYLSRSTVGRVLTKAYYRRGLYSLELALEKGGRIPATLLGLVLVTLGARRMLRRRAAKVSQ